MREAVLEGFLVHEKELMQKPSHARAKELMHVHEKATPPRTHGATIPHPLLCRGTSLTRNSPPVGI